MWRIYYDNGSVFSSDDGAPESAPLDGVVVIVEWLKSGQPQYHKDRDFYIWLEDRWHSGFERDFAVWVRCHMKHLKHGVCISDAAYEAIAKEAMQWQSP